MTDRSSNDIVPSTLSGGGGYYTISADQTIDDADSSQVGAKLENVADTNCADCCRYAIVTPRVAKEVMMMRMIIFGYDDEDDYIKTLDNNDDIGTTPR